jgi:hypothetical protein
MTSTVLRKCLVLPLKNVEQPITEQEGLASLLCEPMQSYATVQ